MNVTSFVQVRHNTKTAIHQRQALLRHFLRQRNFAAGLVPYERPSLYSKFVAPQNISRDGSSQLQHNSTLYQKIQIFISKRTRHLSSVPTMFCANNAKAHTWTCWTIPVYYFVTSSATTNLYEFCVSPIRSTFSAQPYLLVVIRLFYDAVLTVRVM
jgi:hypothetical protein